jgi:hypothetical protein
VKSIHRKDAKKPNNKNNSGIFAFLALITALMEEHEHRQRRNYGVVQDGCQPGWQQMVYNWRSGSAL